MSRDHHQHKFGPSGGNVTLYNYAVMKYSLFNVYRVRPAENRNSGMFV